MSEKDSVEFKWLEAKPIGNQTVVFNLEDGTQVRIRVDINRAGVSINSVNPDGSPQYHFDIASNVQIVPAQRKFKLPKQQIGLPRPEKNIIV
jgi:hypothetical protein